MRNSVYKHVLTKNNVLTFLLFKLNIFPKILKYLKFFVTIILFKFEIVFNMENSFNYYYCRLLNYFFITINKKIYNINIYTQKWF